MEDFYGNYQIANVENDISLLTEEVNYRGFAICEDVFDDQACNLMVKKLIKLNDRQNEVFGLETLSNIGEANQVRLPLSKDRIFFDLIIRNEKILSILDHLFFKSKSFYVLNQQNAVINSPKKKHNQAKWHRDFPYFPGILPQGVSYSFLIALTDFNEDTGGTKILPFSHLKSEIPSWDFIKKNTVDAKCGRGSIIVFDSQVFHCAGNNVSNENRVAINNIFTNPLFRQQIVIPESLAKNSIQTELTDKEKEILGYKSWSPSNDEEYKKERIKNRGS